MDAMVPTDKRSAKSYRRPSDALLDAEADARANSERVVRENVGGCGRGRNGETAGGIVRPTTPWPQHRPEGAEVLVDWIARKVMNGAQRFRNFSYKVLSWRHASRLGLISHKSFHLRRLHCDPCTHRHDDMITGLEFCNADSCGCGKKKRACLNSKLKLAGWKCPKGFFGTRNQVNDPRESGERKAD